MKTIREVRRGNLRRLAARFATQKEFAEAIDTPAPYISQLTNQVDDRSMGDDVARRIESRLELPSGWMDTDHDETVVREAVERYNYGPARINITTVLEASDAVEAAAQRLGRRLSKRQRAILTELLYAAITDKRREPPTEREVDVMVQFTLGGYDKSERE